MSLVRAHKPFFFYLNTAFIPGTTNAVRKLCRQYEGSTREASTWTMRSYKRYVDGLETRLREYRATNTVPRRDMDQILNGQAGTELRSAVALETRRKAGAFFTGSHLARTIADVIGSSFRGVYFDPSCGAGDLILAVAKKLPLQKTLHQTLRSWGKHLAGLDRQAQFVRACKIRLALLALHRGARCNRGSNLNLDELLPYIQIGNALNRHTLYEIADEVLMNPPYTLRDAPRNVDWASGTVTAAAVHFEWATRQATNGTSVTAILPDVLRSGSRYSKWRNVVEGQSQVVHVKPFGIFDKSADVDVFVVRVKITISSDKQHVSWMPNSNGPSLGQIFDVCVGPVVPYRHLEVGSAHPYVEPKALPPWQRVSSPRRKRRFSGPLFTPPFVVIRRTSRPEDQYRAVATLITGQQPIAVENHLIICSPKDRTIKTCKCLLRQLKSDKINKWFNARIRCRHLTVVAIRDCPLSAR